MHCTFDFEGCQQEEGREESRKKLCRKVGILENSSSPIIFLLKKRKKAILSSVNSINVTRQGIFS